jgi:hypothetical protein
MEDDMHACTTNGTLYHPTTLQPETVAAFRKLPTGVVSQESAAIGLRHGEPLVLILDALTRYARAHETRFGAKLAEDYVLGPAWLEAVKGVHGLLDGDGAVAHELDRSSDSKDNGMCEAIFWAALAVPVRGGDL